MDGAAPKIEIFKPFGEAFELTKKILFQPFDLKKWFVIGFAAFLALLPGGCGGGPNFNFNFPFPNQKTSDSTIRNAALGSAEWEPWLIALLITAFVIIFALVVVLLWVGSRGRFIFVDCVVHNRAAIVAPWKEFRREGNSLFLFGVVTVLLWLVTIGLLALPIVLPLLVWKRQFDAVMVVILICVVGIYLIAAIGFALCAQFMVPIMYRRRCMALEAFRANTALVLARPWPIILYTLFLVVLALAFVIVSCVATCVTCCIAALPYIGTVILLPVYVFLLSYSLLFLRQFGPEYDVWARFSQPEAATLPPTPPPMPS
jgi:hypothetical protein